MPRLHLTQPTDYAVSHLFERAMSQPTIVLDQISKMYRIGRSGHNASFRDTFDDLVQSLARRVRGFGNDRSKQEDFWALKDVSFEIKQGEAIGLLGRNGAGKSTLLKVLSRITEPTSGVARLRGRVGSLLEVGTGFHPDLTGRENIYLNGSILGMRRHEIHRRFDEIVEFSEVERFLDTPVKRYSSGMYIRLAFAVAAHLEPEILLVDEVLSVGDTEFQRKCLGKMNDVVGHGRTVIFVSHQLESISALTSRCLVFKSGQLVVDAPTDKAVRAYIEMALKGSEQGDPYISPQRSPDENYLAEAKVLTSESYGQHLWGEPLAFEFVLHVGRPTPKLCFHFTVLDNRGTRVAHFWNFDESLPFRTKAGDYRLRCEIPKSRLYKGRYTLTTSISDTRGLVDMETVTEICPFEIIMGTYVREAFEWAENLAEYLEDFTWTPVEAA